VRWPDENRRSVARRYAESAGQYRQVLMEEAGKAAHGEGLVGEAWEARMRESRKALRGLNPWQAGKRFEELVGWLGEFDSARTLLEEWPAMRPWVTPGVRQVGSGLRPEPFLERRAGGRPPEWMRSWLPLVSVWERGRGAAKFSTVAGVLSQVYSREALAGAIREDGAFLRYLKGNSAR
jgi:hypothetical protein